MPNTFEVEFGRPNEREHFIGNHERFFERLPNLQKALDSAFVRENSPFNKAASIISALGKLCMDDFSEILLLCANGFGNAAMKSLRGMYERLVTARYIHLHPDLADAFWDFHIVKLSRMEVGDLIKKYDPDGKIIDSFKISRSSGRKRLKASWADLDFVQMAGEVGLDAYIMKAYRLPLEFAHPSVTAILPMLEFDGKTMTIKEIEPQRDMVEVAFPIAHFFVLEVLRLQSEHFALDDPIFQQCIDDCLYILGRDGSTSGLGSS